MVRNDDLLAWLEDMSPARLRAEWRRLHRGQQMLDGMTPSQMQRAIAWRLQANLHGAMPPAKLRELDRLAQELETEGDIKVGLSQALKPGTRLIRRWHGKTYVVTALEDGFELEDRHFSSLTKIAHAITGTAWSGPRFFGLKVGKDGPS